MESVAGAYSSTQSWRSYRVRERGPSVTLGVAQIEAVPHPVRRQDSRMAEIALPCPSPPPHPDFGAKAPTTSRASGEIMLMTPVYAFAPYSDDPGPRMNSIEAMLIGSRESCPLL